MIWILTDLGVLQSERAYQKQPTIFQNKKRSFGVKKVTLKRYTRNVGLGFKTPSEVNGFGLLACRSS
jgi:small subunit ribosomal protein S11e